MATQTRLPTGVGTNNSWTSSSGGSKWLDVDDTIGAPDDDSTYIFRQNSNSQQDFTFSAFSVGASDTISKVTVHIRVRRTAAGAVTSRAAIRVGGVNTPVTISDPGTAYVDQAVDWTTNPNTGVAWTPAEVNGTDATNPLQQFGVLCTGTAAGEEIRCTSIYIEVTYTPAGGSSPSSSPSASTSSSPSASASSSPSSTPSASVSSSPSASVSSSPSTSPSSSVSASPSSSVSASPSSSPSASTSSSPSASVSSSPSTSPSSSPSSSPSATPSASPSTSPSSSPSPSASPSASPSTSPSGAALTITIEGNVFTVEDGGVNVDSNRLIQFEMTNADDVTFTFEETRVN